MLFLSCSSGSSTEGITYWAWTEHGPSLSILEGANTAQNKRDKMRIAVSRSHPGNVIMVIRRAFTSSNVNISPAIVAGAGYKSLLVAQNNADLYLHTTMIKKWDVCPGNVLLDTLGGKMTTRQGRDIDYQLNSNPEITEGIVATLSEDLHTQYMKKLQL